MKFKNLSNRTTSADAVSSHPNRCSYHLNHLNYRGALTISFMGSYISPANRVHSHIHLILQWSRFITSKTATISHLFCPFTSSECSPGIGGDGDNCAKMAPGHFQIDQGKGGSMAWSDGHWSRKSMVHSPFIPRRVYVRLPMVRHNISIADRLNSLHALIFLRIFSKSLHVPL